MGNLNNWCILKCHKLEFTAGFPIVTQFHWEVLCGFLVQNWKRSKSNGVACVASFLRLSDKAIFRTLLIRWFMGIKNAEKFRQSSPVRVCPRKRQDSNTKLIQGSPWRFVFQNVTETALSLDIALFKQIDSTTMAAASPRSNADESMYGSVAAQDFMSRLFSSCSEDPKGSVHRAWGLTLIFLVIFFVVSAFESTSHCDMMSMLMF